MKAKWRQMVEQAEKILEMPEGALAGDIRMETYGNRRCVLEGRCRVQVYEEDRICLKTAAQTVCFRGTGLRLVAYEKHSATVVGRIACVEFS